MEKYHKIQTVFKRNPETKFKTLLMGEYALLEFEYLAKNTWVFTEKIDGTNIRVNWQGNSYQMGMEPNTFEHTNIAFHGRTDKAQIPPFLVEKLQEMFSLDKFIKLYPETPMTLYGEGYGARIQKGGGNYISDGVSFILFDIMIGGHWLKREDVEDIASHLKIDVVPTIGKGTLQDAVSIVQSGFQSHIGSQIAEGLVMRPEVELTNRMGHRIITKIKHKDF